MPYESIRKPGDPKFVPSRAGGLGGGIGSHAGHRMAYDARILFRITVGFSAAGRLSLGRAFSLFPKAERAFGTGSPANPKLSGWKPGCTTGLRPGGEFYRLFHSVNALVAVLSAHADNEQREKRFLKNTIADISHQLKTPLAALNIYNGLLQDEAVSPSEVKEFADLSEQELDRIETLVQNLLKITRLDAGSVVLEKKNENVAEMVQDIARQYHYRAEQEQKKLVLSGSEAVTLWCDRDWMQEAVDNLVKNALDHTKSGDTIQVEWNALPSMVQIKVRDNGSGIHPEDLYHIFKRFYRSRFSQDTQGIGLGLPLAKAVVEAHHGTIEVDSELGKGTTFTLNFPIPTKL